MFGRGKTNFTIDNGEKVKSNVTGFAGIITARADHLHGCNRYYVTPPVDKDGKLPDGYWMDEAELEIVEGEKLERANNKRGGFPSKIK
jgi:hypothetical protein